MEIIVRLREEREALVSRIAKIDEMLHQYDEWGREAQRLLSLTNASKAESLDDVPVSDLPIVDEEPGAFDEQRFRQVGNVRVRHRPRPALPTVGRKTPISEFEAAVIDVLREANRPMDRVALYDALTARGIVIGDGGRDKDLNALSARVYRMAQIPENRISGERGQGYRLMTNDEADDATPEDESGDEAADPLI